MATPSNPSPEKEKKTGGLFLKYEDFQTLERIIEEYNLNSDNKVDYNRMTDDEKQILYKIKTILHNMESVRLRPSNFLEKKEE